MAIDQTTALEERTRRLLNGVSAFAAGTMFRFPLRTQRQVNYSELSTETWSVDQIAAVFQQFQAPFWKPKRGWFVPAVRGCGSQTGGM